MIKILLIFIFTLCVAWFTKDYFSIVLPDYKKIENKYKYDEAYSVEDVSPSPTNSLSRAFTVDKPISLSELLKQDKFYDAMAYYLEYTTTENLKEIEKYLAGLVEKRPKVSLEYMKSFLDAAPESNMMDIMIKTYISQGDFPQAVELIMQTKENYISEAEDGRLTTLLRTVSLKYIDILMHRNEYAELIVFLEDMMDYDDTDNFYKFRLATLYMKLEKVEEAAPLLEVLQYDEVYAQNVNTLLASINTDEDDEGYEYAIALQRYGDHYTVNVSLDGSSVNLMLDTGATYILVDEDKASFLDLLRDDLVLRTVGHDVHAKLGNVKIFQMGNLLLENTQVTIAPFKRKGIDGLLGMNFFKQFSFFINQEEGVLYLNRK